ncbi:hypothetical protein [Solicola sp. PLA-1-18]|uniref:hypothetical protein n=1 Tax=Solicola sp. PLA-1-18 TaxID=3380532 RepID=UPI003B79557C
MAVATALFMASGGIVSVVRAQTPIGAVWNDAFWLQLDLSCVWRGSGLLGVDA